MARLLLFEFQVYDCPEVQGRGIKASQVFKKGEFVVEYKGRLLDNQAANDCDKHYASQGRESSYMYYFSFKGKQLW